MKNVGLDKFSVSDDIFVYTDDDGNEHDFWKFAD